LGLGAKLILKSEEETREVALFDYFLDYKKTILRKNELIVQIKIPQKQYDYQMFFKTVKRKNVDISSVSSCVTIVLNKYKQINEISISFGGVFAFPKLAVQTMKFLEGKDVSFLENEETLAILESEFTPLSDVRGSEIYRKLLIRNHLKKHYFKLIDKN